mgnify:CR=1 FL=1
MFKYSGGDPTVPCIVEDGEFKQSGLGRPFAWLNGSRLTSREFVAKKSTACGSLT